MVSEPLTGLDRLRELAEQAKAEGYAWQYEHDSVDGSYDSPTPDDCEFPWRIKGVCNFAEEEASETVAAFIAAANPDVVRALCDVANAGYRLRWADRAASKTDWMAAAVGFDNAWRGFARLDAASDSMNRGDADQRSADATTATPKGADPR